MSRLVPGNLSATGQVAHHQPDYTQEMGKGQETTMPQGECHSFQGKWQAVSFLSFQR
jgi:hypothetical protein